MLFAINISMTGSRSIVEIAAEHVSALLSGLSSQYTYHDLEHTRRTAAVCRAIGKASNLAEPDLEIVILAGWFHDTGFTEIYDGHEERSVEIATRFLQEQGYPQERIDAVGGCIRATKADAEPATFLQTVIRDADIVHTGKKNYAGRSALLRAELENIPGLKFTDREWAEGNIAFMANNPFRTLYARGKYTKQRIENLSKLQRGLQKNLARQTSPLAGKEPVHMPVAVTSAPTEASRKEEENKGKRGERGIETMFRITSHNHISLSSLADGKAHILISINALVISLVMSLLLHRPGEHRGLVIPGFILLAVCLATIVFATMATRPRISGSTTSANQGPPQANLLFFGSFSRLSLDEYERGMKEMMETQDALYGSMVRDIHSLGRVIAWKYRYLRISYNVFMYGLVASVIAFAIAYLAGS